MSKKKVKTEKRVLVKPVGKPAAVIVLPPGDEGAALRQIVGGMPEPVPISDRLTAVLNENGHNLGLESNTNAILGTFVIVRYDRAGRLLDMEEKDQQAALEWVQSGRPVPGSMEWHQQQRAAHRQTEKDRAGEDEATG